MKSTVRRWGNSLGVRIPHAIAKELMLHDGVPVEITEENKRIVITPDQGPSLERLLAEIGSENLHGEIEFGKPTGNEAW